jgi:hypothetical protein
MFRLQKRVGGGVDFANQSSEREKKMMRLTLTMTHREFENQVY